MSESRLLLLGLGIVTETTATLLDKLAPRSFVGAILMLTVISIVGIVGSWFELFDPDPELRTLRVLAMFGGAVCVAVALLLKQERAAMICYVLVAATYLWKRGVALEMPCIVGPAGWLLAAPAALLAAWPDEFRLELLKLIGGSGMIVHGILELRWRLLRRTNTPRL